MQQFASLRVLALAVLPMPVLLGLVLWFVLKSADGSTTAHLPSILLVAVVAVLAFALIFAIGYRSTPFRQRSEEHTPELQSLMRTSYAVFCLTKKINQRAHYA